jgi:hypothetical protein
MVIVAGVIVNSTLLTNMLFHDANLRNKRKLRKLLHIFYYKLEEINEKLKLMSSISFFFSFSYYVNVLIILILLFYNSVIAWTHKKKFVAQNKVCVSYLLH